jgi:Family of unknown function (DUF6510)
VQALDGNAIAGELFELFGMEMTTATGACAHCATTSQIAELRVYSRAPGTVVRCRSCGGVVIVLVAIRGTTHIHLDGFERLEPSGPHPSDPP